MLGALGIMRANGGYVMRTAFRRVHHAYCWVVFKGAMSPNTHAQANENKLEKDSPTFSSCVGDFGRLCLSV